MPDEKSHIEGYLDSLRTQRKLSGHTVRNYQADLTELASMAHALSLTLEALTQAHIRKFAAQLHGRGLNPRSIGRKLSAWRGFFNWLSEHKVLACNPVEGVRPPKSSRPLPKALATDDAVHLVSHTTGRDETSPAAALCNRAMFELLYSSGLRVSELAAVDVRFIREAGYESLGWMDLEACEVMVTGKGRKMRSVPVGKAAVQAIREWLTARETLVRDNKDRFALFLTARGTRISPRLVQLRLKAHALALGIPVNVHPHVLRHSFASHVLQSSGDLRAVQEMLGHSSISATQVYTSLDFQRLAQVYDASHPRARKQQK